MVAKYNSSSHLSPRKLENEKGFRDGPTTLAVPLAQRSPFLFSQLAHLPSLIINDHRRIHRSSPRSDSFHHCLVFFNILHCTASDLLVSFRAACCFRLFHVIRVQFSLRSLLMWPGDATTKFLRNQTPRRPSTATQIRVTSLGLENFSFQTRTLNVVLRNGQTMPSKSVNGR